MAGGTDGSGMGNQPGADLSWADLEFWPENEFKVGSAEIEMQNTFSWLNQLEPAGEQSLSLPMQQIGAPNSEQELDLRLARHFEYQPQVCLGHFSDVT